VDLITRLVDLLPLYGPWLIFGMVFMETCFITGLVFPSGLATSVATVLALEGGLELMPVVLAAAVGGFLGDSVGFWIGALAEPRLEAGTGRFARRFRLHHDRLSGFFGRHPVFSVTMGRLVSFVRTLMPMAAGMSALSYPRFLLFEIPGLAGYVAIYVAIGFAAGESWELAVQSFGLGGASLFAAVGVGLWIAAKRRGVGGPAEEGEAC
jgi:membrane protein DedA with SNARE-associated domain